MNMKESDICKIVFSLLLLSAYFDPWAARRQDPCGVKGFHKSNWQSQTGFIPRLQAMNEWMLLFQEQVHNTETDRQTARSDY